MRLFLCLTGIYTLAGFNPAIADNSCSTKSYDETATVDSVHDGDTLRLKDGRKIRLVSINTPELARDNKPAEPYALAAKNALKKHIRKNSSIRLIYGKDSTDRYGRTLAHVFTDDGNNVQAYLLRQGLASVIIHPPNTRFISCYQQMEKEARCNNQGIWKNAGIIDASNLKKTHTGFHLIQGKIRSIKRNKKGIWLNIDDRLTAGIRPQDAREFSTDFINSLTNQSVIVRGWLNKSRHENPFYIRLRHPSSIQLASAFDCPK